VTNVYGTVSPRDAWRVVDDNSSIKNHCGKISDESSSSHTGGGYFVQQTQKGGSHIGGFDKP